MAEVKRMAGGYVDVSFTPEGWKGSYGMSMEAFLGGIVTLTGDTVMPWQETMDALRKLDAAGFDLAQELVNAYDVEQTRQNSYGLQAHWTTGKDVVIAMAPFMRIAIEQSQPKPVVQPEPKPQSWRTKFEWAIHNLIAHPVMEFLSWFGLAKLGDRLHDATVPRAERVRVLGG